MKQQIRYKNYRSLLLLLGMLAVTVWGYGQRLEVEGDPTLKAQIESGTGALIYDFDNRENEGRVTGQETYINRYPNFCHEREEIIYLNPGDEKEIEVMGDAKFMMSTYVYWYVGEDGIETNSIRNIKNYMSVTEGQHPSEDRYLYCKRADKEEVEYGYLAIKEGGKASEERRFVKLKVPAEWNGEKDIVINCDLSSLRVCNFYSKPGPSYADLQDNPHHSLFNGYIRVPKLSLRRKYIIRHASKMASAINLYNQNKEEEITITEKPYLGTFNIHTAAAAKYLTLRLPLELSNYYTGEEGEEKKPALLYWKFYKKDDLNTPIYTARLTNFNDNDHEGFLLGEDINKNNGGTAFSLRPHVLDVMLSNLGINENNANQRHEFVVKAFVSTNIPTTESATEDDGDLMQIVEYNLCADPYLEGLTDAKMAEIEVEPSDVEYYRTDAVLENEKYYKMLGILTFNNEEKKGEPGEGHNGDYIVDNDGNAIVTVLPQQSGQGHLKNIGFTPFQEKYSDYGFSDFVRTKDNSMDATFITAQYEYQYIPARGEYGFMRYADGTEGNGWTTDGRKLYDRRAIKTGKKEFGFFMYVDADETPGLVTRLPMDNVSLCPQTQIVVTAWVANLVPPTEKYYFSTEHIWEKGDFVNTKVKSTDEEDEDKKEIDEGKEEGGKVEPMEKLTDEHGFVRMDMPVKAGTDLSFTFKTTDGTILYKYYTGELRNNVRTGEGALGDDVEWQQVYMSFTLPEGMSAIDEFSLEVASNCLHSDGGDFAIDDIRVYKSLPYVNVTQTNLCDETSSIRIRTNYNLLLANIGLDEERQLLDSDTEPTPTWSQDSWNFTVDGQSNPHTGDHPRHYHMYYTIAEKYTPDGENPSQDGCISKDRNGWVVPGKNGEYWRYLFLNYTREGNEAQTDEEEGEKDGSDAFGTAIISVNKEDIPTLEVLKEVEKLIGENDASDDIFYEDTKIANRLNAHELAWLDEENMNYVVFDTLTVDPKLLVAGQTYYVQLFPHKLAGDARPTPDDPCAISSTFVIEKSHTIYLKDGAELTDIL